MTSAPGTTKVYTPEEQRNREIVLDYYSKLIGAWDFDAASAHLGSYFVQHNPTIADGLVGLEAFTRNVPPEIAAVLRYENVRILVDGDMVMMHGRFSVPGVPDKAVVDLFRLENGKVVEHWDVIQDVPAEAVHDNGMF